MRKAAAAAGLDAGLVLAFVMIGRSSHAETLDPGGIVTTAWPFLAALALGWIALRAWKTPRRIFPTALGIWATTVGGGLFLRAVAGEGVEPGFVIVTGIVLAVFLLGWRAVAVAFMRKAPAAPVRPTESSVGG